ncbi:MAG: Asp-tRNA(Asn)/Glu-tRNA(Gln) amidotransferase subunit GatB [Patescibacteria group bacterium]|jgi:aspartyl-tRNA(Asn)/glutamyl-tRNA(Gln) amidotransferase subunit B
MKLETIIGLEIHVQLNTKSKMFCACSNDSDQVKPNTNVCPICMGHPGVLPVTNQQAVDHALLTALALHCKINEHSKFDRKNYFYPDLPKGYQISQLDQPVGEDGRLIITIGEERKRIGITRLHMEEDAAKLTHPQGADYSLVDFNRAGSPLIEIVTEPDIRTPAEARIFLTDLKLLLEYLDISDADMEKGNLRCDANISLRPEGDRKFYTKTEIKNMNSFRGVERALTFEIERQTKLWEAGTPPDKLITMRWLDDRGITKEERSKEEQQDYRYFPEPDLAPLHFTEEYISSVEAKLPELPDEKRKRFHQELGTTCSQAVTLTYSQSIADFFENTITELSAWVASQEDKSALDDKTEKKLLQMTVNWITTELFMLLKESQTAPEKIKISPENMAELVKMVYLEEINSSAAQQVLRVMFEKGSDPSQVVQEKNLKQMNDSSEIESIVEKIVKENEQAVADYQSGNENVLQFLVGQVMKETKGKVNPKVATEMLKKMIG